MTATQHIPTLEEVAALLRGAALTIGRELRNADDDWPPVLVLQHQDGWLNDPIDLTPYFQTHATKHALFRAIPKIVETFGAHRVALMLSAWVMPLEPNADGSIIDLMDRPEAHEHPQRREELQIIIAERGRVESWLAPISRSPFGPTLEQWEQAEFSGAGVLTDALKAAWS